MTKQETLKRVDEAMKQNDCLVAKEIMENMEKLGISPSVAINGKVRKLCLISDIKSKIVTQKEKDEFVSNLEKYGCGESDFWFAEYNHIDHKSQDYYEISGKLIVVFKKTGKQKEYVSRPGNPWVTQLFLDLKNNFFQE